MDNKRLIMVPRWAGGPETDWYPWLLERLKQDSDHKFEPIITAVMPQPDEPVLEEWLTKIIECMGTNPAEIAQTVLIGHSVGCLAILHYLAQLKPTNVVTGILCVAGWFEVDNPWPSLKPWIEAQLDYAQVKAATKKCIVLLSDNDPFTADWAKNQHLWKERVNAKSIVVPGAQHFNHVSEPAVLQALNEYFG